MASCSGCDNTWSGLRMAHCPTCHLTFSTPTNFDRHRIGTKVPLVCCPPEDVGLVANDYGTYRQASEPDLTERFH